MPKYIAHSSRLPHRPASSVQAAYIWLGLTLLLSACQPSLMGAPSTGGEATPAGSSEIAPATNTPVPLPSPYPTRPLYQPGELVDYIAQTGDTLPTIAARFNTSVAEILAANSFIPADATTMPPGMPMKIPIYYLPLWGSPYAILPDQLFINGPAQVGFDIVNYVAGQPGWLAGYVSFAAGANRSGAEIVARVARDYSLSPRLLLALLEYQSGALSRSSVDQTMFDYPLGYRSILRKGLYLQLLWAANTLNNSFYRARQGKLLSLDFADGRQMRFDPWLNAASVALQYLFNTLADEPAFQFHISQEGFARTYSNLFGDPWSTSQPHIPGSLVQPEFSLPFPKGDLWALTGGPHSPWGDDEPLAALDFAPPAVATGCQESESMAVAMAPGVVVRSEIGQVMLDLDGDGDERTGWNIFYLHLSGVRPAIGTQLAAGDLLGHPSCEGGRATGTHVHIARKYNGEWILAEGVLAFRMDGWVAYNGSEPYQGSLKRGTRVVTANASGATSSWIERDER